MKKNSYYLYVIYDIIKQPPLLLWTIISAIISIILFFSELIDTATALPKILILGKFKFPYTINGEIWMKYFVYCLVLLAILVLPKHFLDTLNKNRISLILSKNISRKKFIIHEIIGVYSSIQIYSLSFILILLSVYINFHYFPLVLLFLVFSVPIVLTIIYTTIMLVVFLTRSYGFALIVLLIHFVVISPALESREIIFSSLYNNTFVKFFLDSIFYLLPQFSALISFSVEGFTSGMMTLVMCFSFFPLFGLFVLKFIKKDF